MSDDPPYTPVSCSRNRKGQSKREDAPDLECPTPELSQGYRILQGIIGISKFFLEEPDHREKGMHDYYDVISKPMWFRKIQQKFAGGEYSNISEFIKDVRCLLLNCYTYFGPHDVHTKRALKVEQVLEQKIALLPADLRAQCSLESTHDIENAEPTKYTGEGIQSELLQSVAGERSRRECERKQKIIEERRKEREGKERDLLLWEQEELFTGSDREKMENMWELPVIGHFVALSLEQLNIKSISMYELERIILMPQASKSLAALMTTLLSTPLSRMKLHTKPPMPYKIWTRKLDIKVSSWYKIYIKSNKNPDTVFEKLGIEHQFWKIMGDWNPLKEYEFHELTFHQRVSLIKALCDYIMQNHKSLKDTIAERRDEFGKCLGEDRSGAKFLYFPQFLDHDVRIYRQTFEPKSWIERDLDHQAEILAESINKASSECGKSGSTMNKKHRRRLAWNRGKIVKQHKHPHPGRPKKSLKSSCESPETNVISLTSKSDHTDENSVPCSARKHKHPHPGRPRKSLKSSCESPETNVISLTSKSDHTDENSVPCSAVLGDETCLNERDSKLLDNVISSPLARHSPESINEHLSKETHSEHSNGAFSHISTNCETGEIETSAFQSLNSELEVNSCKSESKEVELNSSQTVISENLYTSPIESQFKKCSGESSLCSHLKSKEACDINGDMKVDPLILRIKNDSTVKESEWTVEKVSSSQTENVDENRDNVITIHKIRRPMYNPYWLEPNPDDFKLVADSVEGVRQLLMKYCEDDLVLIEQLDKKSRKQCHPSCEVKLAHRLVSLMNDLESVELKILTSTKGARERLYNEWQDFKNRSADYIDPDEAFWLNEKEPVEVPECHTPQTQASQNSDTLEDTELPETQVTNPDGTSEGLTLTPASGMKLRHRVIIREKYDDLSDESSEDDSDESDNWVMPKSRKSRSVKRKKMNLVSPSSLKKQHTSEEHLWQPPPKHEESSRKMVANSMPDIEILDDVSKPITEKHPAMSASALRVKKRLFFQNEASNSEANRQLEWEKNRQKLVNLAANKAAAEQSTVATSATVIVDNMNKIILDGSGKITVSGTNNKALLTLQGRKIGDVIKQGKFVKKQGLITGVIGIEMEKGQSHISGVKNREALDGNIQAGKCSSKNFVNVSKGHKQEAVSPAARSRSCVNKTEKQATETTVPTLPSGQVLQSHVVKRPFTTANSATSSTSTVVLQNSVQTFTAISASVEQSSPSGAAHRKKNVMLIKPVTQKKSEVVCISDDSDNSDVEFVGTVYNPKLDYPRNKKNKANPTHEHSTIRTQADPKSQQKHISSKSVSHVQGQTSITSIKSETSLCSTINTQDNSTSQQTHIVPKNAFHVTGETSISGVKPVMPACSRTEHDLSTIRTQDNSVLQQTHFAPKTNPHMQGEMSTAGMKPVTSASNSVAILPNHFQTLVANPQTLTTQFAPNTTLVQDKIEQQSPGSCVKLEMHIASQNQDNMSETLQKPVIVQPGGSVKGLRNLQTESVQYVQSKSPGPYTVDTVVSALSPSSTKSNLNIHLDNSVAASGTITHTQKFNSISNIAVGNLGINLESQLVPTYIPTSQSPSHTNSYVATARASPGTPLIQVKTSSILSEQTKRPVDSFTQVSSPGATVAKTKSPASIPSSFSKIPGTSLAPTKIIAPPVDQAKSPSMSCEKIRYPVTPVHLGRNSPSQVTQAGSHSQQVEIRSPSSSLVKTRNPDFSSTLTRSPHTPVAHTRHLDSSPAITRGSGISLDEARVPGTPAAKRRILGTPVMHTRSPVPSVTPTRSPAIHVAHTRIPGTPVAKTRSPSTPVTQTRSPGNIHFAQTASPGASLVQARSSPLFQDQIHGVHISPTGASVSHGRENRNSGPERASSDVQQQLDQTAARLVVIPGDENVSKYAIVFPSGAKVILTPKQVADIRAANGGLLTTHI